MREISDLDGLGSGARIDNCGGERCPPGHAYGPAVRDHYLIHYVASGKGVLYADNRAFEVGAGQGFVIFPNEVTTYVADEAQPWAYDWVGYMGENAGSLTLRAGLSPEKRVFACSDADGMSVILRAIAEDLTRYELGELAAIGGVMRLLARIGGRTRGSMDARQHKRHYDRAIWFMEGGYAQPVTVEEVAAFVGLSRSQLYRVFREVAGHSPKEVLTDLRLRHACRLLSDTNMSLEDVAASVGMASAQRLGVAFRTHIGKSPSAYRAGERVK